MDALRMGCDRISELPDSLLTHILSYLSTKDSVKTSVLSKRWEFLWLNVSGLDLNAVDSLPYGEPLLRFMYRFLEFNRGSCLQTFKMKYCRHTKLGYDSKNSLEWITQVVHRQVQHLDLESRMYPRRLDIMPECVYVSKTLVYLSSYE
ncbi:putative F-box protein [Raphanus sativus]|nr:putative F-box protein [Raphanus sativus]